MFRNYLPFLEAQPTGSTGWMTVIMVVGLIAVFYFFMIRPQRKRENEVQHMRDNLVVGDEITTIGGIIGKIISIKEETCMIETGKDKTRMRILKSAVRCVDVPNEAARELLAKQRAEEAEKAAAEKAAKEEEARKQRLENAKGGKKGKTEKTAPADEPKEPTDSTESGDSAEE